MAMVHKKDDYLLAPEQTAQKGQLSQRGATGAENTPNGQQIMQTPAGSSAGGAGGKSCSGGRKENAHEEVACERRICGSDGRQSCDLYRRRLHRAARHERMRIRSSQTAQGGQIE